MSAQVRWYVATAVTLAVLGGGTASVHAQFKDSLVQAPRLSAPERGSIRGALSGIGFTASDLARGAFRLPLQIGAPEDRGPLQAGVVPAYSPDTGLSEWGMGWGVDLSIRRHRLIGEVDYATDDFVSPWGRLRQGDDGLFYPSGLSASIRLASDHGDWVATTSDGTQYRFSAAPGIKTPRGSWSWQLTHVTSLVGDLTTLEWTQNPSGRPFLTRVSWGGRSAGPQYQLTFDYETIATAFIDHSTGAALDRRVSRVAVAARNATTGELQERWHYQLAYHAAPFGPAFYLDTIQRVFASGELEPAMTYRYELDETRLPAATLDRYAGLDAVVHSFGDSVLQPDHSAIHDVDIDGRPDFEVALDLTLIQHTDAGWTQVPLPPATSTNAKCRPRTSSSNVPRVLARLTGDLGEPQVLSTTRRSTAPVTSQVLVCDRLGHTIVDLVVPNDWQLGPNTRLVDIDRDHRPDIVRIAREGVRILHNESDAQGIRFVELPLFPWALGFSPTTSWLNDLDGDGNVDVALRSADGLYVQFGLGNHQWTTSPTLFHFVTRRGDTLGGADTYQMTFVDANKDGVADVLLTKNTTAWLYTNRGASFNEVDVVGLHAIPSSTGVPIVVDLVGDGNVQVAFPVHGTTDVVQLATPMTGLLTSADDGMGTVARFTYARSAARPGVEQRTTLLDTLTVESSGYDTVSYRYSYGPPVIHTIGWQLVGFASVDKRSPFLTEHVAFLNDDDVSGIYSLSEDTDDRSPGIVRFTHQLYDDAQSHGVRWLRPALVETGHRSADGSVTLSTTTQYLAYQRDRCPTVISSSSPNGQLITTTTLASVASLPDDLHCLPATQTLAGVHADPSLDFSYVASLARNDLGQVTRITQANPAGLALVLQDIAYDADHRIASIGAPGRGTTTFGYDALGRLLSVTDPTGVATQVSEIDPVCDALLALQTLRPNASTRGFFAYDARERLQASWDDLSGGSQARPLASYAYQDASSTAPGRIDTQTLADAITGTSRHAVALLAADGEPLVAGSWLGDHYALGTSAITFRNTLTRQHRFVGTLTADALSALTSSDLRSLGTSLVETTHAGFGHAIQATTTQQDSVVGTATTEIVLTGAELITRVHQPGGFTAESAVDAAGKLARKTDENGVVHRYSYDALGRLVRLDTPDGAHTVVFDGFGRPARITRDGIGSITYLYDLINGLPIRRQHLDAAGSVIDTHATSYDAIGRPLLLSRDSNNDTSSVFYDHDGQLGGTVAPGQLGRLTRVRGDGWERSALFDPLGRPYNQHTMLTGWRDLSSDKTYRADGSVASDTLTITDATGTVKLTTTQETVLDAVGRIGAVKVDGAILYTLSYDGEGRLARADFTSGEAITFDYDPVTHRRRGYQVDAPAASGGVHWDHDPRGLISDEVYTQDATTTRRDYTYDGRGALTRSASGTEIASYSYTASGLPDTISDTAGTRSVHRTSSTLTVGDVPYTWDTAGRVIARGEWTFGYGASGQLTHASRPGRQIDFTYDDTDQRILKRIDGIPARANVAGGVLTEDHFVELVMVGDIVAGVLDNGQFTALLTDPRGTPFAGPDGTPGLATPYGVRSTHLGLAEAIDYTRLGWDPDLDVVRMGARDYDPKLSQFLAPDPLYLEDLEKCQSSPLQCALYGYAAGNPISFTDPTGLETWLARIIGLGPTEAMVERYTGRKITILDYAGKAQLVNDAVDSVVNPARWAERAEMEVRLAYAARDQGDIAAAIGHLRNAEACAQATVLLIAAGVRSQRMFGSRIRIMDIEREVDVNATTTGGRAPRVLTVEELCQACGAGNKTDRLKAHILNGELGAARRELAGEVVRYKASGVPYDHVDELGNAQRGLLNRIKAINAKLSTTNLESSERAALQKELGEASKLLDLSEGYLPR